MLPARILSKIEFTETCWLWTSGTIKGYGQFWDGGTVAAHRAVWVRVVGRLPREAVLHHKCGVLRCVNPGHMEVFDSQGLHLAMHRGTVTHCKHGHEFTPANTYRRSNGNRGCRTCNREAQRRYQRKKGGA